jgi:hypothetical protein
LPVDSTPSMRKSKPLEENGSTSSDAPIMT